MTTDSQIPPSVPPSAVPPVAPKKPNQFVRIGIGCLGLIVLGCVAIGGLATFQNWQQDQNYATAHAAYLNADCASAFVTLRKVADGDPGTKDRDVARKAEAELQECQVMLDTDTLSQQGKAGDAVLGYSQFVTKYDKSPLMDLALSKDQELASKSTPEALASVDFCQSLPDIEGLKFITTPDTTLPPLLNACGQAFEEAKNFSDAATFYARFRDEYPDHSLAQEVQDSYVRATIADAELSGAGELPAPQATGGASGSNTQMTVVIQNDTPEKLSIVFSGPETRVEELDACTECDKFTEEPTSCPEKGPVGRYVMAPGTYKVVVKTSSGGNVTPFSGTWDLTGSEEYSSCFYVVTR